MSVPVSASSLRKVGLLYRDLNMSLWGLPYTKDELRPGQSPRHFHERDEKNWVWLGTPGWFGSMTHGQRRLVEYFLKKNKSRIPGNPYEYDAVLGKGEFK